MIEFFVEGEPKPQKRPRIFSKGGKIIAWSPKDPWRAKVAMQGHFERPKPPYAGPVGMILEFRMPRRKATPKSEYIHTKKPDLDNLAKGVIDALQDAKFFLSDSQISDLNLSKRYAKPGEPPGVLIKADLLY